MDAELSMQPRAEQRGEPLGRGFGLPVGIAFFGRAYSEPVLLKLAYAFEPATQARRGPKFLPTVG